MSVRSYRFRNVELCFGISPPSLRAFGFIFKSYNIDTVNDVGANTGQFATGLRSVGFKGRII